MGQLEFAGKKLLFLQTKFASTKLGYDVVTLVESCQFLLFSRGTFSLLNVNRESGFVADRGC